MTHMTGKCNQEWISFRDSLDLGFKHYLPGSFPLCTFPQGEADPLHVVGNLGENNPRPIFSSLATLSEHRRLLFHCSSIVCLGHVFIFELVPVTGSVCGERWGAGREGSTCELDSLGQVLIPVVEMQVLTPKEVPLCLIGTNSVTCPPLNRTPVQGILNS